MGVALTEEVQDLLRGSNWMPVRHIATGGGGAVYLGVNRALINAFDQHDRLIELRCAQQVGRAPPRGRDVGGPKHNVLPALAQTLDAAIRRNNIVAAVKVPKAFDQEADKKRFQREIATTGRLPHPNLIRLLDADSGDPPRWFAMDYHANGPLQADANRQRFRGQPLATLTALRPVADALALLHDNDIQHRDVKPNNIFVADDGRLVLGDFGIALPSSDATRLTATGSNILSRDWSPDWMQFSSAAWTAKSDVYQLALVIHYLLAGENTRASQVTAALAKLKKEFPRAAGIAEILELLGTAIVTQERDCAFADAREFVREIDRILEGAGAIQRQSVFSFLSPRMDLDLRLPSGGVEALPTLKELPVVLPFATRALSAKIRLHGEGKVRLGFRIDQSGQKSRQVKDEFALGHAEHWPGQWVQLSIRDLPPLPPGHYDLTVEGATKSATISALLLYAESTMSTARPRRSRPSPPRSPRKRSYVSTRSRLPG